MLPAGGEMPMNFCRVDGTCLANGEMDRIGPRTSPPILTPANREILTRCNSAGSSRSRAAAGSHSPSSPRRRGAAYSAEVRVASTPSTKYCGSQPGWRGPSGDAHPGEQSQRDPTHRSEHVPHWDAFNPVDILRGDEVPHLSPLRVVEITNASGTSSLPFDHYGLSGTG